MNVNDSPSDLQVRFERQRAAFGATPYPSWEERADRLRRLQRLLHEGEADIVKALDRDYGGRPAMETQLAEIWPSLEQVKLALRRGRRWMKPRRAGVSKWFLPARGRVLPQPLGVVGVIVPWNYPLFLAMSPMIDALAAGNRVMVKMSELVPIFSGLMQSLCAQLFAPDEVSIITGGTDVAEQFSALPFDHLLFTGSTAVGRKVMRAASVHLTPVTLELGGKSPTVIAPEYPLEHAVERILMGKLLNAGQTCIAPDYLLLPRPALAPFVEKAQAFARRIYPQGLADADYCSVINERHYRRLTGHLDEIGALGVRCATLFEGAQRDDVRRRLAPLLIIDPPLDSGVMRDEIFGPLLPVIPYERIEDALTFIKLQPRPLALYWFDHDRPRIERVLQQTHAGGVSINETLLHVAQNTLPFGGVGASGMGHYHGRWGFDTFSKLKPVFEQSPLNALKFFLPPYGDTAKRLIALMKRY